MEEREFFSGDNVYVSLTRFVAFGQTYAMSGVTSVRAAEIKPDQGGSIILFILALIFFFVGLASGIFLLIGVVIFARGLVNWASKEIHYSVMLTISSGQVQAVVSKDQDFISKIVQAVNDCIVARG